MGMQWRSQSRDFQYYIYFLASNFPGLNDLCQTSHMGLRLFLLHFVVGLYSTLFSLEVSEIQTRELHEHLSVRSVLFQENKNNSSNCTYITRKCRVEMFVTNTLLKIRFCCRL